MTTKRAFLLLLLLSATLWAVLAVRELGTPPEHTFSSDGVAYNAGALHLRHEGIYSLDGRTPTMEREPGYSAFLAAIYTFSGDENRLAIFLVQYGLFLLASWALLAEVRSHMPDRARVLLAGFLFLFPSLYHVHFLVLRESLLASLIVFLLTVTLRLLRERRWVWGVLAGLILGAIALTGLPFLFLPLFLAGFLLFTQTPRRFLLPLVLMPFLCAGLWGVRNRIELGRFSLSGDFRTTVMLYARAQQALHVQGAEPFWCLWSEYVSRDWSGRSFACSFNGLVNTKWPGRVPTAQDSIIRSESMRTILQHPFSFLWFSVFELLEYHLPFVDGWGHWYNLIVSLAQAVLYGGIIFVFRRTWSSIEWLCVTILAYSLLVYVLTDATPRYHVPVLAGYAILAALGYNRLLSSVRP